MKKILALMLLAVLAALCCPPAVYAKTRKPPKHAHNKYQGLDKESRRAQKREQKSINRYNRAQQKYQHRMMKKQKHSSYKPKKNR